MLIVSVMYMTIKWPFWKLLGFTVVNLVISGQLLVRGIELEAYSIFLGLLIVFLPFYGLYRFNKYFQVTQTLFGDD